MSARVPPLTLDHVQDAARRLDGRVHRTPVLTSRSLDKAVGHTVFLKCENRAPAPSQDPGRAQQALDAVAAARVGGWV